MHVHKPYAIPMKTKNLGVSYLTTGTLHVTIQPTFQRISYNTWIVACPLKQTGSRRIPTKMYLCGIQLNFMYGPQRVRGRERLELFFL